MITAMTKYSFILLRGEKDGFLDRLQELGVVDISRSQKPVDDVSGRIVADIDATRDLIKCITAGSDAHLVELPGDRLALVRKLEQVNVWGDYDREKLAALGAKFYRVPKKQFNTGWEQQYALQTVAEKDGSVWFENYRFQGGLVGDEVLDLLGDVEDDDDADYEQQRHEEGQDELLRDVKVEFLESRDVHILELIFLTVASFQELKSPCPICRRAWRTRSR